MPRKTQCPWSQMGLYSSRRDPTCQCGCSDGDQVPRYILATWRNMMQRCHSPNNPSYHRYGGRGIDVCQRMQNVHCFWQLLGPRPAETYPESGRPTHVLGRSDADKGYHCGECEECQQKGRIRNISWETLDDQLSRRKCHSKGRPRGRTALKESMRSNIRNSTMSSIVHDNIDLVTWLPTLPNRDKEIIESRLRGMNLQEIGNKLGLTRQAIRYRLDKMITQQYAYEPYMPKIGNKWVVTYWIPAQNKKVYLGSFSSLEEARASRQKFAQELQDDSKV